MNSIASPGLVLGSRFVLDRRVAVGGMGQVWKATDSVLERAVAVKVLRPDLIDSGAFLTRFRAEARLAARLSHPGIAHVYDYDEGVHDGERIAYLVMEWVEGEPLSAQPTRCVPWEIRHIVSVLEQTAVALGAAHELGIIHRDVKPGNLLITADGRVKVTDFGIARAVNAASITEVGQVIGTVQYMSPEQALGAEVTAASDIYSLGVVGYEMVSGDTPFGGDSPAAVALAHVQAVPPALPAWVPDGLRSLIERSLAKAPDRRPQDGAAFATALRGLVIESGSAGLGPTTVFSARASTAVPEREATPVGDLATTAIFERRGTSTTDPARDGDAPTAVASAVPASSMTPLLGHGRLAARRRGRRLAGLGAAVAVAAFVLILIVLEPHGTDGVRRASSPAAPGVVTTTAAPPATAAPVTIDPATYRGLTEAQARDALSAVGLVPVTTTGPSTVDLTGVVIDVQPAGPVSSGSSVTIILGDGTIAPVTDPPADEPANGKGRGRGKAKSDD